MYNNKVHTPVGSCDVLQKEKKAKNRIEQICMQHFAAHGYADVQTPMFEFLDVFTGEYGCSGEENMLKFFDAKGRILALRPDITPPIARIAATKLSGQPLPLKLSYVGPAFRGGEAYGGEKQKEFTQAGVELMGVNSPEADAEVIALTVQCLLAADLKEFQIDLGQMGFFKALVQEAGLSAEDIDQLVDIIDHKDFINMETFTQAHDMPEELRNVFVKLPTLFGDIDVVRSLRENHLPAAALAALDNLIEIYEILRDYGVQDYISIDLGMVKNFTYYTGVVFKGFTHHVGFPICGGGRYDNLVAQFGRDIPGAGVAIWVDRVLAALQRSGVALESPAPDTVVSYAKGCRALAFQVAEEFRRQGMLVDLYLGDGDAAAYAKEKGVGGMAYVRDDSHVDVTNFQTGEVNTLDMDKI
ncbi:MAG: ATP phosphoribosyltransferase regulatory subunit [Clostridia bacterium]|nr:ATP phosphoribosyltransferase regulatory subunit [Clostridia bacterium]